MEHVDTLIHARWIIPVEPDNTVHEHHSLAIKDGRIHAIVATREARQRYHAAVELDLDEHALIPGLVNAHTHAAMSLFRGLADDLPLMDWLNNHIWPAEGTWVSPEFARGGGHDPHRLSHRMGGKRGRIPRQGPRAARPLQESSAHHHRVRAARALYGVERPARTRAHPG